MTLQLFLFSRSIGGAHNSVTSFFKTVDLIGRRYLALLIPSLSQLQLLSYDVIKGEPPSFGSLTVIHAGHVIPLPHLSMMLVLDGDKQMSLYSGLHKVAMVTVVYSHSEDMDGSAESVGVAGIRDALGDSFTLELATGGMLRCSLPSLCRHPAGMFTDLCIMDILSQKFFGL